MMRKASRRPWNEQENQRRRRQIERGVIDPATVVRDDQIRQGKYALIIDRDRR